MAVNPLMIEQAAKAALERSLANANEDETVSEELALAIARAISAGIREYDRQDAHSKAES